MRIWFLISVIAALYGCTESNFSGGGKTEKQQAATGTPGDDSGPPSGDARGGGPDGEGDAADDGSVDGQDDLGNLDGFDIPDDCTGAGATQAKLLTNTVQNGIPGNFVEYELFLTDCSGQRQQYSASAILFDIDATSTGAGKGIPLLYEFKNRNVDGELEEVRGSDLFGKTGPTYYHNRTDKPVSFSSPSDSVVLRIDLRGNTFAEVGSSDIPGGRVVLPTYLRFGDATPVRKDVTFIGTGDFGQQGGFGNDDYGGGYGFGP